MERGDTTLANLYQSPEFENRTIVVRNIPHAISHDTLEDYIEVVTYLEPDTIFPNHKSSTFIAVLKDAIQESDWKQIESRCRMKKLSGRQVTLQSVGTAVGLVLYGLPTPPKQDFLMLYFERHCHCDCSDIQMFVDRGVAVLSFPKITKKVLLKVLQLHCNWPHFKKIEPYFPKFHDVYIKSLPVRHESVSTKDVALEDTEIAAAQGIRCTPARIPEPEVVRESVQGRASHKFEGNKQQNVHSKPMSSSNLLVLGDDGEDESRQGYQFQMSEEGSINDEDSDSDDSILSQDSASEAGQRKFRQRAPRGGRRLFDPMDPTKTTETIPLPRGKIIMLRIGCISRKSPDCKFDLDTTNEKVTVQGDSTECVQEAKIKMYEVLNLLKEESVAIDPDIALVFSSRKGSGFIHSLLKRNRKRAFVGFRSGEHVIYAYAFSPKEARDALSFTQSKFGRREYIYTDLHVTFLNSSEWLDFVTQSEKGNLLKVRVDGNERKIVIAGVLAVVQRIVDNVRDLLANKGREGGTATHDAPSHSHNASLHSVSPSLVFDNLNLMEKGQGGVTVNSDAGRAGPKQTDKVKVEEGFARCLMNNKPWLDGLYKQQLSGTLVDINAKGEITVEVTDRGTSRSVRDVILEIQRKMWSGNVDLRRISKDDTDVAIMCAALLSSDCHDFVTTFERQNTCGVVICRRQKSLTLPPSHSVPDFSHVPRLPGPQNQSRTDTASSRGDRPSYPVRQSTAPQYSDLMNTPPSRPPFSVGEESSGNLNYKPREEMFQMQPSPFRTNHNFGAGSVDAGYQNNSVDSSLMLFSSTPKPYSEGREMAGTEGNVLILKQGITELMRGSIVHQRADCLVNFLGFNGTELQITRNTNLFIDKGGNELKLENMNELGFHPRESCGGLMCQQVLHLVLECYSGTESLQVLRKYIKECFGWVETLGHESIAFPAVGVGRMLRYPPKEVARILMEESEGASQSSPRLKHVFFVVYDKGTLSDFIPVMSKESDIEDRRKLDRRRQEQLRTETDHWTKLQQPRTNLQPYVTLTPARFMVPLQNVPQYNLHRAITSPAQLKIAPQNVPKPDPQHRRHQHNNRRHDRFERRGHRGQRERRDSSVDSSDDDDDDHQRRPNSHHDNRGSHRYTGHQGNSQGKKIESVPEAVITVYCTGKMEGEKIRSKLSQEIKEKFLAKEQCDIPIENKEDVKKVYKICKGFSVCAEESARGKTSMIRLRGERSAVDKALKEVYKFLASKREDKEQERKRRTPTHPRGHKDYWKFCAADPPTPLYWKHFQDGLGLMDKFMKFVGADPRVERYKVNQMTFTHIEELVQNTWTARHVGQGSDARNLRHSKIKVRKIERIENLELYTKYARKRQDFFRQLAGSSDKFKKLENIPIPKRPPCKPIQTSEINKRMLSDVFPEMNEHYFFHGTKRENEENILTKGLDNRVGSDNGMFGLGVYAAESSTKADQYADDKDKRHNRDLRMLLIRVLLGNMYVTNTPNKYKKPPCSQCYKERCTEAKHMPFDSVVGDGGWLFREFVVYSPEQCYPEYVITYDRQ